MPWDDSSVRATFAAGLVLAVSAVASGCGNLVGYTPPPAGITGIRLTADDKVEIVSYICAPDVDTLSVVSDREGLDDEEENPVQALWTHDDPVTGLVTIRLAEPGADWRPQGDLDLEDGAGYLIDLSSDDRSTLSMWITPGWSGKLRPGVVYVMADPSPDKATFRAITIDQLESEARRACDAEGWR